MRGVAARGTFARGTIPRASMGAIAVVCSTVVEAPIDHVLSGLTGDPQAQLVYVVEIEATPIGPAPEPVRIYAATQPFITRSTDNPPNQPFDGTLEPSITLRRSIISSTGFTGFAQSVSEIVLTNAEGTYDSLVNTHSINGRRIVCRVGRATGRDTVAPFAQFEVFANLIGHRWRASRDQLIIETRDLQAPLDVPVQTSTYIGNGGLNGGEEIGGQFRPYGDGYVFNATPALVIAAVGLYQYNDGPVYQVTAVRDGGIALTFVADYPTIEAMLAAAEDGTIGPGQWASCKAQGYFIYPSSRSAKQVTCDFIGLRATTADIIRHAALTRGGLTADEIDEWTFRKLNLDQPAPVGIYLDPQSGGTCNEMFRRLMQGIGGWHGISLLGRLQVRRFDLPRGVASAYYSLSEGIGSGNLVEIEGADLPDGFDPPPRRQRVMAGRNHTVQTELYGQVSEDDPSFANRLRQPHQLAVTVDATSTAVLDDYRFAPDPEPVEACFANLADAQDEADRRMAIYYGAGLKAFRLKLRHVQFMHDLGEEIAIRDGGIRPRFGLDVWRYVRIVEINDDISSGDTDMVVVG